MNIDGIMVSADPDLTKEEISEIVSSEVERWRQQRKALGSVELIVEGDNIVVKSFEKSPIKRVRRITGYLSSLANFNDAKRAEHNDRIEHGN